MPLALSSQNSDEDDTNDTLGMLKAFIPLVFPIFLVIFLALTLVVLMIESQVLQLSALLHHVLGTFVKRAG